MKGYSVYNAIKQLKDQDFKKAVVARQLDINRRTHEHMRLFRNFLWVNRFR